MTWNEEDGGCLQHRDSPCNCKEILDRMPDFLAEPSPEPEAAPASEAQSPAVPDETRLSGWCTSCDRIDEPGNVECSVCGDTLIFSGEEADYLRNQLDGCAIVSRDYQAGVEYLKESGYGEQWKFVAICRQSLDACIDELAQLRARVAILDAQEVELPEVDAEQIATAVFNAEGWGNVLELSEGSLCLASVKTGIASMNAPLLDARRAVQAWREVAQRYRETHKTESRWSAEISDCDCAKCTAYDALAGKDGE